MRYAFAGCELDTDRRELSVHGDPVHLEPRVFDVLAYLVAHRDRVVPKEELLDELWGDRFVSEATLAGNIRIIRAAVGDDGRTQAVIKTAHGRGYRFVAGVEAEAAAPAGPVAEPPVGNLPLATTRLIGRDDEVAAVVERLDRDRLVTLVGPGGVGKTRLAIEVGRRLEPAFPDGVWLVPLDTVGGAGGVEHLLLGLLGIAEAPGRPVTSSLVAGLRARRCLLVLDNCEHVLAPVAAVAAAVLRACPHVRLVATSREPLDIHGEQVQPVDPLEVGTGCGPAVELFHERAAQAGRTLDRTADGRAVVRICEQVDGLPLAIELAAARVRSLTPGEIADRLADGFALLAGARRTAPSRHRTIVATLQWSYDLLDPEDRWLLDRLSVFRGSFGLDAVEGVCAAGPLLDGLDRLAQRSLVVAEGVGGRTRFRLLEVVRGFGHERLAATGEADDWHDRHARWYLELLARADAGWRAGDDQRWWPVARAEQANLRAAFDHFAATGRADEAQRLAVAAYGPIVMHFDLEPELDWAPRACDLAPHHVGPWTARARAMAAWGAAKAGDLDAAVARARSAVAALEAGSPDDGLVTLCTAVLPFFGGPRVVTGAFLRRARDEAMASGDLNRIVWVLTFTNRAAEAVPHAREQGNLVNLAIARRAARVLQRPAGEPLERRELEEIAAIADRSHSSTTRNNSRLDLALFDLAHGDAERAAPVLGFLARDWLHRGDARAWTALAALALALDGLGDRGGAVDLARATEGRPVLRHPWAGELLAPLAALRRSDATAAPDLGAGVEEAVALGLDRLHRLGLTPAA